MRIVLLPLLAITLACSGNDVATCERPVLTEEISGESSAEPSPRLSATWTISEDFTASEAEVIVSAGSAWRDITGGRVDLKMVIGPVPDQSVMWTISRGPIGDEGSTVGWTTSDSSGSRITLDAAVFEGDCAGRLWLVTAHELGHTLGIQSHGTEGVMATGYWPSCDESFTQSDVVLFDLANP